MSENEFDKLKQDLINKPLTDPNHNKELNKDFLGLLLELIEKKEIDLYKPSTLINDAVYNSLNDKIRGKTDFEAVNLLSHIRNIKNLYDLGYTDTFQFNSLIESLRLIKERIELEDGDVFKI